MKQYSVTTSKNDPEICLKLPKQMLKDLVIRAHENGRSIEVELALRLARSLEHDLAMLEADNKLAQEAFERLQALLKKHK